MIKPEKTAEGMYKCTCIWDGDGGLARVVQGAVVGVVVRRSCSPAPWCFVVVLIPSSFASPSPSPTPVYRFPFHYPSSSAASSSLLVGGSSSIGGCGCVRWIVVLL